MRRLILIAMSAATLLVVAACGSSGSSGSSAGGPLTAELSYYPQATPFVATIDTKAGGASSKQLQALQSRDPQLGIIKAGLFAELAKLGIDYNTDVKPLLGNPIAFGIGASQVNGSSTPFLAAWQTSSQSALARLVSRLKATKSGTHDGATMYTLGGAAFATDGALVLVSNSAATITAALDRHGAGDNLTAADYERDTAGLPSDPAVSMVGDLQSALDSPSTAKARKVPWVAALKSYGVALTGSSSKVSLAFRVDTTGRTLTDDQLPIASGTDSPGLAGSLPILAGLRDPGQVWAFIVDTEKAADPSGYRKLLKGEAKAQGKSGVDVDQFVRSLTGDLDISSDGHHTVGCLPASSAQQATYEKLLAANPGDGSTITTLGGGFYRIREKDGTTLVGGVANGQLLLGNVSVAQERAYAQAPRTASGGSGAVAFKLALAPLLKLAMHGTANPLATQITSMLGDVTGSLQATPQALTGSVDLALKQPAG